MQTDQLTPAQLRALLAGAAHDMLELRNAVRDVLADPRTVMQTGLRLRLCELCGVSPVTDAAAAAEQQRRAAHEPGKEP